MAEKREAMLNIFHSTKEAYNLKELEKLGGKAGVGASCVCVWKRIADGCTAAAQTAAAFS